MKAILCSGKVYEYKGYVFEFGMSGPAKLRRDGSISKQQGRSFLGVVDEWYSLSKEDREKYRIGGGCQII